MGTLIDNFQNESVACDKAKYTFPKNCPKFIKCNASICPLDADWHKRVLLKEDPTCYYLTQSVKDGADAVFEGAGMKELYFVIVRATQSISERHARIRKALERARLTSSRMTTIPPSGG